MAVKTAVKKVETEATPSADGEGATLATAKTKMYLLSALAQDGQVAINELTKLVAEAGSKVEKSEDLGVKRLAFAINKHRALTLVSVFFPATPAMLKDLSAELKHAEKIERYLLTDWKADLNAPARRPRRDEVKKEEN